MTSIPYVLGFLFDSLCENVVLIRKRKPQWQAGRLNGAGGKVHLHEKPLSAMRREFKEETGLSLRDWHPFAVLRCDGSTVHCYCASTALLRVASATSEPVEVLPVADLAARRDLLDNVPWLVLAARENWWSDAAPKIEVSYPVEARE